MKKNENRPLLDGFRLAAALLVVMIHTSPLETLSPTADFWLTRVLGRVAVPFFLMASGYFLAQRGWRGTGRFVQKAGTLYLAAILLYLPLNLYAGGFGWGLALKKLLFDGTFYHLWYLPGVMLGALVARALARRGLKKALAAAGLLYLIGLGGDSYYGIAIQLPGAKGLYDLLFHIFSYTRNGLFFAPLFLLLGAAARPLRLRTAGAGLGLALAAMSAEAFWLRGLGAQRHDSMYLLLPLVMVFLFGGLLGQNRGQAPAARRLSTLLYILHPWCIVLVRGLAKAAGAESLFIQNSLGHFGAVALLSLLVSLPLLALRPHRPDPTARAWKELDGLALAHNVRAVLAQAGPGCELMAVVKADAYGHGAVQAARLLQKQGVRAFAVACLSEGVQLRKGGIGGRILILGYTPPQQAGRLAFWRLEQAVVSTEYARELSAQKKRLSVHLALDTGMRRIGLPAEEEGLLVQVCRLPGLRVKGVFSHLCVSDSLRPEDIAFTQEQTRMFYGAVEALRRQGIQVGKPHLQASYGLWNQAAPAARPGGYVRAGIALYGVYSHSAPVQYPLPLRPVLSLKARVAVVRFLKTGQRAGYGLAFEAKRPTCLAVLAIGYADGLPRDLAQRGGQVLLNGRRAPMVGRLCMDQLFVDATEAGPVQEGQAATLIGRDREEWIRAEELAEQCGTITNELLSRLGPRLDSLWV